MWRLATIIAAAFLTTSGAAWAADKPSFKEADADGNGKVSVQEAKKAGVPKDEAKSNDLDDDGKLTKNDWEFVDMQESSDYSS